MSTPLRPSPLSFDTGRQSPFQRQNSNAATTSRATTPTRSPAKPSSLSPLKAGSLSPEKASPFVRRPSQITQAPERAASPFGRRPTSSLDLPSSPSRQVSSTSGSAIEDNLAQHSHSRQSSVTPMSDEEETARSLQRSLPSPFDGPAQAGLVTARPSQTNLRSPVPRSTTASSTPSTIKPPVFAPSTNKTTPKLSNAVGGYNHVPQSLLRSMRESFEVLDSSNSGAITSASVSSMLEQMGLDFSPAGLRDFFPSNHPGQLNLARYLDTLSGPLAELSHTDELSAAFEAFDVDDSGQIDVGELRNALLNTAPEPGETMVRLSEREVDSVLGEFAGRRAFGAKGLNVAKGKGDVFRYRDFMAHVSGGGPDIGQASVGA